MAENTVNGDGFYAIWRKGKNQPDTAAPLLPAGVRYRVEVCAPPSGTTPARQLSLRALIDQLTTYEYDEESFLYP